MAYGSGYVVNFGDVAPAYSSIIVGIGSALGTVGALIGNLIASVVIKQPVLEDWRKLFILFSIMYTIGGIVYLIYGSAVPRKWATFKSETVKQVEEVEAIPMLPRETNGSST
jgi:MFS family permease